MDNFAVTNVFAVIPVKKMERAVEWYSRVFGRGPDSTPMPSLAEWKFAGDRTLQVTLGVEQAGGGMATIVVDDIAQVKSVLARSSIGFDFNETQSEFVKFGILKDPDGNEIAIVEPKTNAESQG